MPDGLAQLEGAPDPARVARLVALLQLAVADLANPCLLEDCDWESQVARIDDAKRALLEASEMNLHDWHRNGLKPPFATVEQWIQDQLGYLKAEDEACYAVTVREEADRGGLAVRILVCSDQGLFDMLWERPEDPRGRHLTSRHYPWADVRGVRLTGTTHLEPETLMRTDPEMAARDGRATDRFRGG